MYQGANKLKWIRWGQQVLWNKSCLKKYKAIFSIFKYDLLNTMCGFSVTEMSKIHIISFYIKKKLIQMNQNFYSTLFKINTVTLVFMSLSTTKNRIIHILASI